MLRFFLILLVMVSLSSRADLVTVSFDEMVLKSELILIAKPIKYDGLTTRLKIKKVIFGDGIGAHFNITRSEEEHEQEFESNITYLIFLKNSNGSWVPASYGRSYWPLLGIFPNESIHEDISCSNGVPSTAYPIRKVSSDDFITTTRAEVFYPYLPKPMRGIEQDVYCYGSILNAINHLTNKASRTPQAAPLL